jgi:hypothetical protein
MNIEGLVRLRKSRLDRHVRTSAAEAALVPEGYGAPEGAPLQNDVLFRVSPQAVIAVFLQLNGCKVFGAPIRDGFSFE